MFKQKWKIRGVFCPECAQWVIPVEGRYPLHGIEGLYRGDRCKAGGIPLPPVKPDPGKVTVHVIRKPKRR